MPNASLLVLLFHILACISGIRALIKRSGRWTTQTCPPRFMTGQHHWYWVMQVLDAWSRCSLKNHVPSLYACPMWSCTTLSLRFLVQLVLGSGLGGSCLVDFVQALSASVGWKCVLLVLHSVCMRMITFVYRCFRGRVAKNAPVVCFYVLCYVPVQLIIFSSYRCRALKQGMKSTFSAHLCNGTLLPVLWCSLESIVVTIS